MTVGGETTGGEDGLSTSEYLLTDAGTGENCGGGVGGTSLSVLGSWTDADGVWVCEAMSVSVDARAETSSWGAYTAFWDGGWECRDCEG